VVALARWRPSAAADSGGPQPAEHAIADIEQAHGGDSKAPIQRKADGSGRTAMYQRQSLAEIECDYGGEAPIQRKAGSGGGGGGGASGAMPADVEAKMERSFGADFSSVRIHPGPQAQAQGAIAYAQGTNLHFAPGAYDPHSESGQQLLGHELAHVVQQAEGRVSTPTQAKGGVNSDPALEQEADDMGARAARGEPARAGSTVDVSRVGAGAMQRYADKASLDERIDALEKQLDDRSLALDSDQAAREELHSMLAEAKQKKWDDSVTRLRALLDKHLPNLELAQEPSKGLLTSVSDAMNFAITGWNKHDPSNLGARATACFGRLQALLAAEKGRIEVDGALQRQINDVSVPLKNKHRGPDEKEKKTASEDLTEIEHAVHVMDTQDLAKPMVMGAQGEVANVGQKEKKPEVAHGKLPPLDIPNLEADAYYLTGDNVLHLDEVKDTPNAFATKIKDKGDDTQVKRQARWLEQETLDEHGKPYEKRVSYFVRADGPKFDDILSPTVIDNLGQIEDNQKPNLPFITIGSESFTRSALKKMLDDAYAWLVASSPAFPSGMKSSHAAQNTSVTLQPHERLWRMVLSRSRRARTNRPARTNRLARKTNDDVVSTTRPGAIACR